MWPIMGSDVSEVHDTRISWLENLKQGISNVLIHPFVPLADTGFNFPCLFSKQDYCDVEVDTKKQETGSLVSKVARNEVKINISSYASKIIQILSWKNLFLMSQLVLCISIFSSVIINDIREITTQIYHRRGAVFKSN